MRLQGLNEGEQVANKDAEWRQELSLKKGKKI